MQRTTVLRRNTEALFSLILGKCANIMQLKLESRDDWKKTESGYVVVNLLNALRDKTYKFEGHKNPYVSIHTSQRDTFLINRGEDNQQFRTRSDMMPS